jgi:hypothetical protein
MVFYYVLAITLAVTAIVVHQVVRRLAVLRSGGTVIGTVVGHEIEDGYEATVDHPVVRFTDHVGQEHTFRAEGPRSKSTRLGARVPVVYLRSNPEHAYVRSFLCMWWNVLLWSFGAVMFWGVMLTVEW